MNTKFERSHVGKAGKDEWLTPPYVLEALGEFDLDPCSPIDRPWDTAKRHYTYLDNGLMMPWEGRVWCNPPYGGHASAWLEKCAMHKNATALVFARTETKMFFTYVWEVAVGLLFLSGRLQFYHVDGTCINSNAGAPHVLIAYDHQNAEILKNCGLKGKFISLDN